MDTTSKTFLETLDEFEKLAQVLIDKAHTVLKNNNYATPSEEDMKIKAMQCLFTFNMAAVDSMKLISANNGKLIFCGNCSENMSISTFKDIECGNFCVDYIEMQKPILVIGRKRVPTQQEYTRDLVIPQDKLAQWTVRKTADAFTNAVANAVGAVSANAKK